MGPKPNVRYTLNLANIYSCLGNIIRFLKSITNLAPPGGATGVIMGFWNKRAARFVTGNRLQEHGNTQKNMDNLGWPPLIERRSRNKVSMLYKIRTDQICIPSEDLKFNARRQDSYSVPYSSVDAHKYSFFPSTIRLWNSLPSKSKSSPSLTSFKASLENITFHHSLSN